MFGATKTFGPQKGLTDDQIIVVDGVLDRFVDATCGPTPASAGSPTPRAPEPREDSVRADAPRWPVVSGIDLVADAVGLTSQAGATTSS